MYNILLVFYEHDFMTMIFPMIFPSFSPAQEFSSESQAFGAPELRKGAEARRGETRPTAAGGSTSWLFPRSLRKSMEDGVSSETRWN